MEEISIDTANIKRIGNEIIKNVNDLDTLFNDLFDMFKDIYDNGIWAGYSANVFFDRVLPQRKNYLSFNNINRVYGNCVIDIANKYETLASSQRRDRK